MAFNFRCTRYSAFSHFLLGFLCIIFGIADRATMYKIDAFHTEGVIAIWMGVWFLITGVLGVFATKRIPDSERPRTSMINAYLVLSIISTVFAAGLLICYGIGVAIILEGLPCSSQSTIVEECPTGSGIQPCFYVRVSQGSKCRASVGLGSMIIIFAVSEFAVGLWSSISCCTAYRCCCCDTSSSETQGQGQIIYLQTQGGPSVGAYVMTQGTTGMPVAVPAAAMTGAPIPPASNQTGNQVYIQNPQVPLPAMTGAPISSATYSSGIQRYIQNPQVALPAMTGAPISPASNQGGNQIYIQNPQVALPAMSVAPISSTSNQTGNQGYIPNPQVALPAMSVTPISQVSNQTGNQGYIQNPRVAVPAMTVVPIPSASNQTGSQVYIQNPQVTRDGIPEPQVQIVSAPDAQQQEATNISAEPSNTPPPGYHRL